MRNTTFCGWKYCWKNKNPNCCDRRSRDLQKTCQYKEGIYSGNQNK
jgi:hypothetical protein